MNVKHAMKLRILALVALPVGSIASGEAGAVLPPPPPLISVSPEFQQVMTDFLSEDFKIRTAAGVRLSHGLAELTSKLTAFSEPETQTRIAAALSCNAAFSTWLEELTEMPIQTRADAVNWGLAEDHLALIAAAYSSLPAERAMAARKLAPMKERSAQMIEAKLLRDPYVEVYIAGMDMLWDLELSPEVVEALWERGTMGVILRYSPHTGPSAANITFRGHAIGPTLTLQGLPYEHADIALEVLKHSKSSLVRAKIVDLLKRSTADIHNLGTRCLFQQYVGFDFSGLITAYADSEIEEALYNLIIAQPQDAVPALPPKAPPQKFWWSSRVFAIATLVQISGQDPQVYGLWPAPPFTRSMVMKNPDDEAVAVRRLTDWWDKRHSAGGVTGIRYPKLSPS